jgi:hypothetical protein
VLSVQAFGARFVVALAELLCRRDSERRTVS